MGKGKASKGRTWMVVTIIGVAFIVALGLGLGLGLNRAQNNDQDATICSKQTTTSAPGSQSPLYVPPSESKEGHYRFASVAADAQECSEIGTRIMARDGGSAVDAAIAAILCVGLHNSHSCGIGGGHFLTYYKRSTGEVHTVIAREQAPAAASEDMYIDENTSSEKGGKAIGIPGEIRGLYEAHKLGGRLPWKALFQPAIRLCRDGITVGKSLASAIASESVTSVLNEFPNLKDLLMSPVTGEMYKHGDLMKRPRLARTLEIIAEEGPDAFYNGTLSHNITADITEAGGIITQADLDSYTAPVKDALKFNLHGNMTAYSPPPPSSGAVYLFIMNVLNGYMLNGDSVSTVDKAVLTWHRVTEAFKHAYSLRTHLGEFDVGTDAFKSYVIELVKNMTSSGYGEAKRQKIDDSKTFSWPYYEPSFTNEWDHGTAHLSVLGPDGDAVSITSTINLYFGSKVVGSRTGIVFNDEMDDFSTPNTTNFFGVPASPANYIQPGKRPLSSMCPSIVVGPDGKVVLVVGASGGTKITTSTALVTLESLWFKWDIKESIDYPRVHHQLFPQELQIQETFPQVLVDGLREKGHNISMKESAGCVVQGIRQEHVEHITANSDYRKHGAPDGY